MKNLSKLFTVLFVCCFKFGGAQTQLQNWFISPKQVQIPLLGPPTVIPIPASNAILPVNAPSTTMQVVNGMYDSGNNLLFYIANGIVYDYNNTIIGTINPAISGAEICIVPFDNNNTTCQRKYNIFTTSGGFNNGISLVQSIVDMNSFSLTTNIIVDNVEDMDNVEYGAIAVSTALSTNNGNRFIYYMSSGGTINSSNCIIRKIILKSDGTLDYTSKADVFPTNPASNLAGEVFTRELELSPDGKFLAWASSAAFPQTRYHILEVDKFGVYKPSTYHSFNLPNITPSYTGNNTAGFRGIEFWQNSTSTLLCLGAGSDGIFVTNIPSLSPFTQVSGSLPFGTSEIELGYNNQMYASSANTGVGMNNIGAFDPSISLPLITPFQPTNSFTFVNPPIIYSVLPVVIGVPPPPPDAFFTLPDQIDGQDYSLLVSSPVLHIASENSYNYALHNTATWAQGSGNNPWNATGTVQIIKELRISNFSHLIIDNMTFKFSPDAKVIIEAGSSLTLTNSTFTSDYIVDPCLAAYTWKGVEVWGDKNAPQNNNVQGKLTLTNNSYIKYAQWGARNYNSTTSTITGGIITANIGSSFYNNNIDVDFSPYQNFRMLSSGKQLIGNISSFSDCHFTTDQYYPFTTKPNHVKIDNCYWITFNNCEFKNTNAASINNFQSVGIKSFNGGFSVTNNSHFINLWRGVEANRSTVNQSFIIQNSFFTNNIIGIVSFNVNNFVINSNAFEIGASSNLTSSTHIGINNQNGSGFSIEENDFRGSLLSLPTISKWGVYINNSGAADNQIYKNNYKELNLGNYSLGVNRNNSNPSVHGLQYLCNQNTLNTNYDIYSNLGVNNGGLKLNQGNINFPAGNTFSHTVNGLPSDFFNNTSMTINYYYYVGSPSETPNYYNNSKVVLQPVINQNTCLSNLNNWGARLANNETQILNTNYDSLETAYLSLLYSYNQLMEGGSTNALLNQIQQGWSGQAFELRNQLMDQSPYLSESALREVASGNVLPLPMLLMVCIANPDATKNEDFLTFLQNDIPNPMPYYMIEMIMASWEVTTARTTLENTLANYSHKMAITADKILDDLYFKNAANSDSLFMDDSTNYNLSIQNWLARIQTLTAKYDLIENYYAENNLEAAQNILDSIPSNFHLSDDQVVDYNDYNYFYNFRKNNVTSHHSVAELNESEIQELVAFTQTGNNFAIGLAQNILCYYYAICKEDDYTLPTNNSRTRSLTYSKSKSATNSVLVMPNPAANSTIFSYKLPALINEKVILTIVDIIGNTIEQFNLNESEGQQMWETKYVRSGLYFYFVKDGNTKIANGKIAVEK